MSANSHKGSLITDGLHVNHLNDDQILVCTLEKLSRTAVDAWIEVCLTEMEKCSQDGRPILALQDLSDSRAIQTPYSKERGEEVTEAYPELVGRTAYVMPDTPDNQRLNLFIQRQPHKYRERRIFFAFDEALTWLQESLETE